MKAWLVTRRAFLRLGALCAAGGLAGCGVFPIRIPILGTDAVYAFKRSGRGRRISNAAKKHNANHVYATYMAALRDPAHRGDRSRIVRITMSRRQYDALFAPGTLSADLRHDLPT